VRPVPGGRPQRPSTVFARAPWAPGWMPGYDDTGYQPEPGYEPVDGGYTGGAPSTGGRQRSGRWIRRGRKIVLFGV